MTPKFSIILPTYNRVELLKIAVASVLAQSYDDWELIVINDGSSDGTKEYLDNLKDDRIRIFHCSNKGQAIATNFGLDQARGEYICFLDDDDYYDKDHLYTFYNELDDQPKILRTAFRRVSNDKVLNHGAQYSEKKHNNPVQFAMDHMCSVCTLAIPKEFLNDCRFIDRKNWLDTHFILRLLAKYPFKQIVAVTYNYRIHEVMGSQSTLTANTLLHKAEDNVSIIREFFQDYPDIEKNYLAKDTVKKTIAKKYAEYATTALRQKHYKLAQEFIQKSYREIWHYSLWKQYLMYYLVKMGLR